MDFTGRERQRRYMARLKARAKAADQTTALKQELAAKDRAAAALKRELARAQAHIQELEKAAAVAARAKPKPARR